MYPVSPCWVFLLLWLCGARLSRGSEGTVWYDHIIGWTSPPSSSYWHAILAAVLDSLIARRQRVSDCWRYAALIGRVCCLLPVRAADYNPASKRSQQKDTRCIQS